ncbi:hypothetical protein L9F63_028042, partial [Diploptera punctata]
FLFVFPIIETVTNHALRCKTRFECIFSLPYEEYCRDGKQLGHLVVCTSDAISNSFFFSILHATNRRHY